MKPVKLLADIILYTAAAENAIESILTANPPKKDDPTDAFFQQFIDHLKDEEY